MVRIFLTCIFVLLLANSSGFASGTKSTSLALRIQKIDLSGLIEVTLSSPSSTTERVWKSSNSWGAANWRVFAVRGSDLFLFREDPDQTFSRNFPAFEEVKGEKTISLNINSEDWIGPVSGFGGFQKGDTIIVVYDVPATSEARRHDVWYGTISALTSVAGTEQRESP